MMQRLLLILVFLVVVVRPQLATAADRTSFVLKDSGFQASSQHRIYWLDDNRIIFTGYEINLDKLDKQGRYGREQNIYIWDIREKHRTVYVKNASLGCYFRGYIRYSILEGPSKKGPMGQERPYLDMFYSKDTWEEEPPEWEEGVKMHPITCRSYHSRGVGYIDLLPEHGYLDYRRPSEYSPGDKVPIVWYRADGIGGAKLPLMVHTYLNSSAVRYEPFLNGYVLETTNFIESTAKSPSLRSDTFSIWLFLADGNVSEFVMPRRDWMRGGTRNFYPAPKGVLTWTHDWGRHKNPPGDAGAYWIQGDKVLKIISEEIAPDSVRVSPDGCKVAFVSEPYEKRQPYVRNSTLHILHACEGE
jgi:hypothetical protein